MSTESLTNSASNASSSHTKKQTLTSTSEQSQLSDSIQNDLTHSTTQLSNDNKKTTTTSTFANSDSRQSQKMATAPAPTITTTTTTTTPTTATPQSSPTKSTPTKSKNKRRNEAKKRSANNKKQQSSSVTDKDQVSQPPPTKPNNQHEDMSQISSATLTPSNGEQHEESEKKKDEKSSEMQPQEKSIPKTTSPSPQKVDEQQQQQHESNDTDNGSVSPVKLKPSSESQRKSPSNPNKQAYNQSEPATTTTPSSNSRSAHDTNSWRRKQRENRELREQIKLRDTQLQNFADRIKQQINKIKELEASLVSTTRTCGQFEKLLHQELTNRNRLESELDQLNATISRLRSQISAHEKDRSANNELIRVLNATLMERETEVSILKLKMTRIQTNSMSTDATSNFSLTTNKTTTQDPSKAFTMTGRSNSEFSRNSYARSTMMADTISARSSTSQLQQQNNERDASIWATVPRELTPSKRPVMLERNLPSIYTDHSIYSNESTPIRNQSTPLTRDRRYRTLPKSMKSPQQYEESCANNESPKVQQKQGTTSGDAREVTQPSQPAYCLVTNLDDSNNTSRSSDNTRCSEMTNEPLKQNRTFTKSKADTVEVVELPTKEANNVQSSSTATQEDGSQSANPTYSNDLSHYSTIGNTKSSSELQSSEREAAPRPVVVAPPPALPERSPSTPVKISFGFKKILGKFKRSDSSTCSTHSKTDLTSIEPPLTTPVTTAPPAFQRGGSRATMMGPPPTSSIRAQLSPRKAIDFQTDKPFAEWDTNMLVDWLTMIGLSMYANQCRRWVKCGAHIMNATPAEVDKGLGITNHLHRKKLRLAISELNGDCDKITKAAAKLDYLWVARWLDDIGLPQYKEAFINARVDGRVLNYLTIEDLISMGVRSLLHHSSIKCGIRVLRSINFDLQLLKRRATAEEIEQMSSVRRSIDEQSNNLTPAHQAAKVTSSASDEEAEVCVETEVQLWTCHRVMEWLRMIDFAEFAPNLRGSGVHGGLIIHEDAFNNDTMSALLSIPSGKTLLRRHLSTYFQNLIGDDLVQRKHLHKEQQPSSQQLNPSAEIKTGKKSQLWFGKLKSSKVGQDGMDEYLCPMYPVEPQIVKSPAKKPEAGHREGSNLPRIPESVNV